MVGSVFAFLQENPLRDCHLRTKQTSRRPTRNYVGAHYLWLNNVSPLAVARIMCHVGTKSTRLHNAPFSKPQWGLTLIEPPRPYFYGSTIRKQERWEEAVNSTDISHSSRKAWSTITKLLKTTSTRVVIFKWGATVWRVSWLTTLFITFLVNPLTKSSSVPWFSQRITQPSSICTSDFLIRRWDKVTCSFVFSVDFVAIWIQGSDASQTFSYLMPIFCVRSDAWWLLFFHDSSPPAFHCDRTCSRYLERSCCRCPYCMPIVSWFRASGLCLWFRLGHFRNAWRLSLSRCQTPRKTKQWT